MAKRGPKTEADLRAELEGGPAVGADQLTDTPAATETAIADAEASAPADQPAPTTTTTTTPSAISAGSAVDLEDDADSREPATHAVTPEDDDAIASLNELATSVSKLVAVINVTTESVMINVRTCVEADRPVLERPLSPEATAAHLGAWAASPTEAEALAWRQQPALARTRLYTAAEALDKAVANLKAAADYAVRRREQLAQYRVLPLVRK